MKNYISILLIVPLLWACSSNHDMKNDELTEDEALVTVDPILNATAQLSAKNNSGISGAVAFAETNGKVSMSVNIIGLEPGNHAIHIHAIGDCSADDGSSAGGHWNPTNVDHGKWGSSSFHIGDIGNLKADSDGRATLTRDTDLWCIGCDDESKNIVGKAIIIHEGPDDFTSQPSGAAGDRIGCGQIVMDK